MSEETDRDRRGDGDHRGGPGAAAGRADRGAARGADGGVASAQGAAAEQTQVVILTGMSGAGRSTAAHAMEDLGWYVVDNLPPQMLVPLIELTSSQTEQRAPVFRGRVARGRPHG